MAKKRLPLLGIIPKGSINYKMGYRFRDIKTGREFTVKPFGYTLKKGNK